MTAAVGKLPRDPVGGNGPGDPRTEETEPGPRSRGPTSGQLVLLGWLALFAFHLWASWRIGGPSVVFDEVGYLGNARWLAGGAIWDMPESPAYASGYSLLLAPIMATFTSAGAQWRAVLVLNAALLASVFPLVALFARRVLGANRQVALAAGALAALAPAVIAAGVSAISENLVLPLVAVSVLASWAMVVRPGGTTRGWPYGYGLTVAALATTHPRFSAVVPVAAGALLVATLRHLTSRRIALVNAAALLVLSVAGRFLNQVLTAARWDQVEQPQGSPRQWIDLIVSPSGWGELTLTAAGQLWYLGIGSLGLTVIGVLVGARGLRRGAPRPTVGREPVGDEAGAARRFAIAVILASAGAVFATSVVFFAQNQWRADHWVYGRHNDSFTPVWIALAVVALAGVLRGEDDARRRMLWRVAVAAVLISTTGLALIVWRDPTDLATFSPFAVPALIRMVGANPAATFWRGTLLGLAGCIALAGWVLVVDRSRRASATGSRTRPPRLAPEGLPRLAGVAGVAVLAAWFVFAGFGVVTGTGDFETLIHGDWKTPRDIRRLGIDRLSIEAKTARSMPTLSYPFALPEVDVTTYDAERGQQPQGPYAVARLDDRDRFERGDRVVLLDEGGLYSLWDAPLGLAVWVAPGAEQDRLDASGLLLPREFPSALPGSARRVELDITGAPLGTVTVAPGGRVTATGTGRHVGTGSPWPDRSSFGLAGRVRLTAQIRPEDPRLPEGARSGGELARWVAPGDRFDVDVQVIAIDTSLQPLPPGRYRVQLGVSQEGEGWFASGGPGAAFVLEVRPPR